MNRQDRLYGPPEFNTLRLWGLLIRFANHLRLYMGAIFV